MDLSEVVGRNCRAIRGEASMAELAEHARGYGARWNSGNVAKVESGAHKLSVPALVILAAALSSMTEELVTVPDLLRSDDPIDLNNSVRVSNGSVLEEILNGRASLDDDATEIIERRLRDALSRTASTEPWPASVRLPEVAALNLQLTEADHRVARSMKIGSTTFAAWCLAAWGRSFIAERNERAGVNANAQRRGQATRAMKDELREAISRANGGEV